MTDSRVDSNEVSNKFGPKGDLVYAPMPENVRRDTVRLIAKVAIAWLESDEGKAALKRYRVNKSHRKSYKKKRGSVI